MESGFDFKGRSGNGTPKVCLTTATRFGHMAAERQTALDILSVKLAIQDGLFRAVSDSNFQTNSRSTHERNGL